MDTGVALLVDVCGDTRQPVATPLPLAVLPPRPPPPRECLGAKEGWGPDQQDAGPQQPQQQGSSRSNDAEGATDTGMMSAQGGSQGPVRGGGGGGGGGIRVMGVNKVLTSSCMQQWRFFLPNVAVDHGGQVRPSTFFLLFFVFSFVPFLCESGSAHLCLLKQIILGVDLSFCMVVLSSERKNPQFTDHERLWLRQCTEQHIVYSKRNACYCVTLLMLCLFFWHWLFTILCLHYEL